MGMRLDDELVGRSVVHRVQEAPGDSEGSFLRKKWVGGARKEDTEAATGSPRPLLLARVLAPIRLGGIAPDLEKATPRGPPRQPAIVLHVAADPAQRIPERASSVGLHGVRSDVLEVPGCTGQDAPHLGLGDAHFYSEESDSPASSRLPSARATSS